MVQDKIPQLNFEVFAGRHQAAEAAPRFNQVYDFWYSIWSATFRELEGREKLPADDFDRHDEITILSGENGSIAGILLLNWYDLRLQSHRHHSYFDAYPSSVVKQVQDAGDNIVFTMGNLGVHPEWRQTKVGRLISDLLVGLACRRFLESDGERWCSYTRNDRKVNELCYRHGAKCLAGGLREHNVSVDIVSATRSEIVVSDDPVLEKEIDNLWARRQIYGQQSHLPRIGVPFRKAG